MVNAMTNHQGLDRARSSHPAHPTKGGNPMGGNWRFGSINPAFGGTTGLVDDACTAYVNGAAGTEVRTEQTIERPARHLGTRST